MPPPTDEQQMEIDLVVAMFGDTFVRLGDDPLPSYSVDVGLSPDEPVELRVVITYPLGYPTEEPAGVTVESISTKRRVQVERLRADLNELVASQIGMHTVVSVLQRTQDYLSEQETKTVEVAKSTVDVDPTIRMGEGVTVERFLVWKAKHMQEKAAKKKAAPKEAKELTGRMTGKQLWDTSIKNADWDLFAGGDDGAVDPAELGYDLDPEAHVDEEVPYDYVAEDDDGNYSPEAEPDE